MPTLEPLISNLVPFMLVAARFGGLFIFTPLLANRLFPRRFRVMLAVTMAAAVYPGVPDSVQVAPTVDLVSLLPLVVSEFLIGLTMGFIAASPMFALDLAGYVIGHQMGLALARVYNPDTEADTDVVGQSLMYLGLGAFVGMGGLEVLFLALNSTFAQVPIGAFAVDRVPLDAIVGVLSSGFELALRVAAPALAMITLVMIGMGFVMKSMPQINVLSVGFTVKILCGLAVLIASLATIQQVAGEEIVSVLNGILHWGRTIE